ncbi:MAG: hypothetical protein WCB15_29275 [Desulfobacterales bacterium]
MASYRNEKIQNTRKRRQPVVLDKVQDKKAINEHPPVQKAVQHGWIKGRNDCWKSADKGKCIDQSYRRRTASAISPGIGKGSFLVFLRWGSEK